MQQTSDTAVVTLCSIIESDHAWRAELQRQAYADGERAGYADGYLAGWNQATDDGRRLSEHIATWRPPALPTLEQACRRASERPELVDLAYRLAEDPRVTDEDLDAVIAAVIERRTGLRDGKVPTE